MILYYAPGACSLASHIALNEAGLAYELAKVDLKTHTTEGGEDYGEINPKGYVPALRLDDGQLLTENVAILTWIADQDADPAAEGELGRYRLLESLAYISTEVHKAFKPIFTAGADAEAKAAAGKQVTRRLQLIAENLAGDYLKGPSFSVADAYLFVMLTWAKKNGVEVPAGLDAYYDRVKARPAVKRALEEEGLG